MIGSARPTGLHGAAGVEVAILLPDLRIGGAERVAVNIANELARRNYRVEFILMRAEGDLLLSLHPSVSVVDLGATRIRDLPRPLLRYLRRVRPEALLACMWPLTALAVAARCLVLAPTRVVVAEHTTWSASETASSRWHYLALRASMRALFPMAYARLAVSSGVADDLCAITGLRRASVQVVPNPIVLPQAASEQQNAAASRWWDWTGGRVLAVGSLKKVKDHETLLRAFTQVRQHVDARLLVLGDGPERASLEALAKELGIEDAIDLPGFVDEVAPYFGRADLHVLSSRAEGSPNVLVESLAAGTPVVSTDCRSGPREILDGGRFGELVPVGDANALSAAMYRALSSSHDSDALRQRAQAFNVQDAVDRYQQVLLGPRADQLVGTA